MGCLAWLMGGFLLRAAFGFLGMTLDAVWPGHGDLICAALFGLPVLAMVGVVFYVIVASLGGLGQIWPFLKWLLRGRRKR